MSSAIMTARSPEPRALRTGRVVLAAAAIPVGVWFLNYYALLAKTMFTTLNMNDFGRFYYAARTWLDGTDLYAPTLATGFEFTPGMYVQLGSLNPPHFHLLILPLAPLSPSIALKAWAAISVLALVLSLRVIAGSSIFAGLRPASPGRLLPYSCARRPARTSSLDKSGFS